MPFKSFLSSLPVLNRQTRGRLQPTATVHPLTPQALAEAERQATTAELLVDKLPEWKAQEGEDWFAKNYYRIYLAFAGEVSAHQNWQNWRELLVGPGGLAALSADNQALVQAYDGLIDALQGRAREPVDQQLSVLQTSGLQRVHRAFLIATPVALLVLLGICFPIWRSQSLSSVVAVVLCLLLAGNAVALWVKLWLSRAYFNPNKEAMAAMQSQYEALEAASLKKIRQHAKDAAVEFHYAAMSGKSWVFSRVTNKWAGEKYIFLGDARYEAACITELTTTLMAQAQDVARGVPVTVKPAANLIDFSSAQLGLTQCPRCRIALEAGDRFCMACGLRLSAPSR